MTDSYLDGDLPRGSKAPAPPGRGDTVKGSAEGRSSALDDPGAALVDAPLHPRRFQLLARALQAR